MAKAGLAEAEPCLLQEQAQNDDVDRVELKKIETGIVRHECMRTFIGSCNLLGSRSPHINQENGWNKKEI